LIISLRKAIRKIKNFRGREMFCRYCWFTSSFFFRCIEHEMRFERIGSLYRKHKIIFSKFCILSKIKLYLKWVSLIVLNTRSELRLATDNWMRVNYPGCLLFYRQTRRHFSNHITIHFDCSKSLTIATSLYSWQINRILCH